MPKAFQTPLIVDIFNIPNYSTRLYGSRRILSNTTMNYKPDFDLYFHISEFESLGTSLFELKHLDILAKPDKYIASKPKYGEVFLLSKLPTLWNNTTADILLFTDERDIAIMDKVLDTLEHSSANILLQDKALRISVYNYMLQLEGFTAQDKAYNCMSINTKLIHDIVVKTYCKNIVQQTHMSF